MKEKRIGAFKALVKRELFLLSIHPVLYVSGLFFVLFCFYNFFFFHRFFTPDAGSSDLRRFFSCMPIASVFCIPALTMNTQSKNSDYFSPPFAGSFCSAFAKWLAVFLFFSFFVLVSAAIPLGASFFADIDPAVLCMGITGMLLSASALIAFGVWIAFIFRSNSLSFFIASLVFALSAFIHRLPQRFNLPVWLNFLCRFTSFSWHFESALRGIADSRDIIFYLCCTLLFLALTAFYSEKTKYSPACTSRRKKELFTTYKGIFLLCCAVLWNSRIFYARLDVSRKRMYSVSDTSKDAVKKLQNRLNLFYYVSAELERTSVQVQQIKDFLYAYADMSPDISVHIVRLTQAKRQKAQNAGIQPQYLYIGEDSLEEPTAVYSGVVLEYEDKTERIPFLLGSADLEFLIADKIALLTGKKSRSVSLTIANGLSIGNYPYVIPCLESAGFTVNIVNPENLAHHAPLFTPVLLIGSSRIRERESEELSSFLQSGGRIFAAVNTNDVNTEGDWKASPLHSNPFLFVLEQEGIHIETGLLADKLCARIAMSEQTTQNYEYVNYPFFVRIEKQKALSTHPVSKAFAGLDLFWASPMELEQRENLISLANTSASAWIQYPLQQNGTYDTDPFSHNLFAASTHRQYSAAAALQTVQGGKIIVVPDQYFLSQSIDYTGNFYNFDFLVNALLWLSDEEGLLSVRNRNFSDYRVDIGDPSSFERKKTTLFVSLLFFFAASFSFLLVLVRNHRKKLKKESLTFYPTRKNHE